MGVGYYIEQSTRQPQTLLYGLADPPIGLLAWTRSSSNGRTGIPWDDDEVLTWISIYYFSRAGPTASLRIYYENQQATRGRSAYSEEETTTVPAGHSHFPKELVHWYKTKYLVFSSEHERGEHFAAYEQPQELVDDLRKMFGKDGGALGVAKDKNGYA
ncbi:putative epoxide hydrolase [Lyophyllum shimeji]|uniref:Epoxide hydrolase n=1 Tax=Lyophyllum shimeji TaxID=47721 RepID=A0A9P3PLM8_LYOSH|nr:putative epoxide hydrolase [Lyophyllum shimeji]